MPEDRKPLYFEEFWLARLDILRKNYNTVVDALEGAEDTMEDLLKSIYGPDPIEGVLPTIDRNASVPQRFEKLTQIVRLIGDISKTTLLNALASEYPQFKIQTESVRYIRNKYGIDFKSGDTDIQMAVLALQLKYGNNPDNYLLDRSSTNSQAYINYYKKRGECNMTPAVYHFIYDEGKKNAQENIDLIIYLKPGEFPIVEDGTRITDPNYIKDTDEEMEDLIREWNLESKVIRPKGSVVERVNFCKKYIDAIIDERSHKTLM